jgi:type IV pilus assembly protein PilE
MHWLSRPRGLSLLECLMGLAVLAILCSVALPSYQHQLAASRRAQAVAALGQLQLAQEAFRSEHGSYALNLRALVGVPERLAHHEIVLASANAQGYVARASALRDSRLSPGDCAELTLTVMEGVARQGPHDDCWRLR